MSKKLYVNNLPLSATVEVLESAFGEFGTVESAQLMTDRDTGRSRGFGFVEMRTDAEAQAAMASLNGSDLAGRAINVQEAKPRERRRRGMRIGRGGTRW